MYKHTEKLDRKYFGLALAAILLAGVAVFGQTTEFTYQGSLKDGAAPANANYDFEFALFDAASGGTQVGATLARNTVAVTNGIFAVKLDFGSQFPGADRYLEIRVRISGGGGLTTLSPRQLVNSAPYSVKTLNADNATTATNATNATTAQTAVNATNATTANNALSLGGVDAGRFVQKDAGGNVVVAGALTVNGIVQSTLGGIRFPDGTTQTSAATGGGSITGVTAGTGLSGGGTTGNVTVNIAPGGVGPTQLADNAVTTAKLADANVTNAKIVDVAGGKITGSITTATIPGANVTGTVANATTAATATNALNLGGVAAGQYVQTGDARLSDARNPLPNSVNYIQNRTSPQAVSSFNISGNGTAGGSLTANGNGQTAVVANSTGSATGVYGHSETGVGVQGSSDSGTGVYGNSNTGLAGSFTGPVNISGHVGIGTTNVSAKLDVVNASGAAVSGTSTTGLGVFGNSQSGVGVRGDSATSAGVHALGNNSGSVALQTNGTSWFQGNTTPLNNTSGTGILIGTASGRGFIAAASYPFAGQTLTLNEAGGNVGIGTAAPTATLSVNGGANKPGAGSWTDFSDERLKNIKGNFTSGLKALMRLQPIRFEYKKDNALGLKAEGEFIGLGAQAVERVIPEAVTKTESGYRMITNDPIIWTMLNGIKEQQAQIATLRSSNVALSMRLRAVEKRLPKKRGSARRHR